MGPTTRFPLLLTTDVGLVDLGQLRELTLAQATRWLLRLDLRVVRIEPNSDATPAGQALEVMAAAVAAAERQVARAVSRWEVVATLSAGLLLANNTSRPYPSLD